MLARYMASYVAKAKPVSYKLQVFYLSDAQNDTGSDWALKFLRQDAAPTYHNITTHNIHNITMTYTLHKYYEHNLHIINI